MVRKSGSVYIYNSKIENATSLSLLVDEEIKEWVDQGFPSGLLREKVLKANAICRNSSVFLVSLFEIWRYQQNFLYFVIFFQQEREPLNYRKLKCHLEVRDPYFLLQPVKKEVLSETPDIFLFHDVLRDREISFFYQKGKPIILKAVAKSESAYACKFAIGKKSPNFN